MHDRQPRFGVSRPSNADFVNTIGTKHTRMGTTNIDDDHRVLAGRILFGFPCGRRFTVGPKARESAEGAGAGNRPRRELEKRIAEMNQRNQFAGTPRFYRRLAPCGAMDASSVPPAIITGRGALAAISAVAEK